MPQRFPDQAHKRLLDKLEDYLTDTLSVTAGDRTLVVQDIEMPDFEEGSQNYEAQKQSRTQGVSYARPVRATLEIRESGETVDESTVKILDLPQATEQGTYIVEGNEYAFPMQKRLVSGVYTSEKNNGQIEAWFNTTQGRGLSKRKNQARSFKVILRPDRGDFVLEIGHTKINLLALLKGLGVQPQKIKQTWGKEVFERNKKARGAGDPQKALKKLYDKLNSHQYDDAPKDTTQALRKWLLNYFQDKPTLDGENVELTLGTNTEYISPDLILQASGKALNVYRGQEDEDNRESLIHNEVYDLADFVEERLDQPQNAYKIPKVLKRNLKKFDTVSKVVRKDLFQNPVQSTFTQSSLARIPKQNNPMDLMASYSEITSRGEGGIESEHAITRDQQAVDPSHLGFIDPMHTPEGSSLGTTLHVAMGVEKDGRELKKTVINVQTGNEEKVTPREFYKVPVAFPEFYEDGRLKPGEDGKIKAVHKGDVDRRSPQDIKYVLRRSTEMFDMNSAAVPFLSHNNGTRGMTASKMTSQAKSLKHREAPKVQAAIHEDSDRTIEDIVGKEEVPKAPVAGTVTKATKSEVVIDGEETVPMPDDFWQNENNYRDAELIVEEGDEVEEGQPLAETNYTKDGQLAIGTNMKTAYTPYKGYNHEDAVVISEKGAEKLTSLHAHQKTIHVNDQETLDKEDYKAYFPSIYDQDQMEKLDDSGVIKEGVEIKRGDPLVVKMRSVEEDSLSKKLKNISRMLAQDYRDTSVTWDKSTPGTVSEVHRRQDDILVVVKTEEKAKVGDKLVGRYGNKGVIGKILSNEEAPQTEDGEPVELMINPDTVPGRMNLGQIMETTASKIADHDGEPYVAKPFGTDHTEKILEELEDRGLKDHETLYDPKEDKDIDGVLVGDHYTLKLEHQVEKKMSSRGAGSGYSYSLSGQPAQGGEDGGRAIGMNVMYALLAHGADANLDEMYTFKGDQNMEAWRNVENGLPVPPPKMPASSHKFSQMMRGMGVNLEEQGDEVKMTPFLDEDIEEVSNGEIEEATMLRAKDLKEEDGGLFDFDTTGGLEGDEWSHIELAEPMPHPVFEKSIKDVTKLSGPEFDAIMAGDKGVVGGELVEADKPGAKTGGEGLRKMLESIDPESRLEDIKEEAPGKTGTPLNKLHREARVLKNFQEEDKDLSEMVVNKIPVIPPKFRPVIELPDGDLHVSDVNEHYRATLMMNNQLKDYQDRAGLKDQADKVRDELYEGFSGAMGLSMGLVDKNDVKGLAKTVAGSSPKRGYFQKRLLKRRQDTSGTGVASPDPKMKMDEIGIPKEMAWDIFEPFTKKELKSDGLTSMEAEQEIEDRSETAQHALERAMEDRPVMANRAPTLHKFSIMGFKPKLTSGHDIKMPVEVLGGFNADFDGDCVFDRITIIQDEGVKTIHIEDFPKGEKLDEKGNVEIYDVEDVKVFGYDTDAHEIRPYPVDQFSVHHDLEMVEVAYKSGRTIEASQDHSLYCVNPDCMELKKTEPEDSVGRYSPRPRQMTLPPSKSAVEWLDHDQERGTELTPYCPLGGVSGYFWGAMVGDGYASRKGRGENGWVVGFCNQQDIIIDRVRTFIKMVGGNHGSVHEQPHTFEGHECMSKKAHWAFGRLGYQVRQAIGANSHEKRLPPFWIYGDEDFRLALLSGLLDTDGSVSISNGKDKPQAQVQYATASEDLADEVVMLCASLGVRANITHHDERDKDEYTVSISTPDLQTYVDRLTILHPDKQEAVELLEESELRQDNTSDPVPIGEELARQMRHSLGHPRDCSKAHHTAYQQLTYAIDRGYVSRHAYKTWQQEGLWGKMSDVEDEAVLGRFEKIAEADNILWDRVESIEDAGSGRTAYDMTVPDCQVFMAANGIIVWDTFGIHVPTEDEAIEEAKDMMPSNNVYMPGRQRQGQNPELQKEFSLGLYKLTKEGKKTSESFDRKSQALRAARNEDINWTDQIKVKGIGQTTAGRIKANEPLPDKYQDYQRTLRRGVTHELLNKVEKDSNEVYQEVIDAWKHMGRQHAYTSGTSLLLSDLQSMSDKKQKMYREADRQVEQIRQDPSVEDEEAEKKIQGIYSQVDDTLSEQAGEMDPNSAGETNNIVDMVDSGYSKPGESQMKQLVGTLGLMLDHRQQVMDEPVRGNYSEGLESSEYWQHMYAQRKGMIDKTQSVAGPGALSKELNNMAAQYKIVTKDCGTNQGRKEKVDDHLIDRVLAEPVGGATRGTIIDRSVFDKISDSGRDKVKVRSILTCEAQEGLCAMCFGADESGHLPQIGKNIGQTEMQAITERSVQLPMKSFHTGGVASAESGMANAFEKADKILRMPSNLPNKATLAQTSGMVTEVRDSGYGGKVVVIDGQDHDIPANRDLQVNQGDQVQKGDQLCEGMVQSQELMGLKGVEAVQDQMRDDLQETFEEAGVDLHNRTYEMPVKSLTEKVRISDAGGSEKWVPGDYAQLSEVKGWNEDNPSKQQIQFHHVLPGAQMEPYKGDDWARRMGKGRIKQTIEEGAGQGFSSSRDRDTQPAFADLALGPHTDLMGPDGEKFGG